MILAVPPFLCSQVDCFSNRQALHSVGILISSKDLFCAITPALRQADELIKVLVHDCFVIDGVPASDFVSSCMMKCEAFECVTEKTDFEEKVKSSTKRDLIDIWVRGTK